MAVRVALNGFGRIGRYVTRLLADSQDIEIAAINARADNANLAYLLKYDTVHRTFPGEISHNDKGIIVNGRLIPVTRDAINEWQWKDIGVDIALETTGKIKDRDGLAKHLECGAKKVVMSAPAKNADATIVMGVNHDIYDPAKHIVVSNASCTTNCLAPVAKVLHDNFGIKQGLMTTVHSYTMSQRILDGSSKDFRRGRAGAACMLPTTTGAAKAVGLVIPELNGKLDGMAIRIPTPNVSLVDLTCELNKDVTVAEVNAALKAASDGPMKDNLGYTDEPLVSTDFLGSTYGGVVDSSCTSVMGGRMVKLIVWYDNESGFSNQLVRLLHMVAKSM